MITLTLVIVLFLGIKFKLAYNYSTNYLTINIVIFRNIYLLKFNLTIINGKFYYYVNNGKLKELKLIKTNRKYKFKMPKIKLYDGELYLHISSENMMVASMVGGFFNTLIAYLKHNKYIIFDKLRDDYMIDDKVLDIKLFLTFVIKFSLVKIIFSALHTLITSKKIRRKYETQSDRGIDGVYS